MISLAVSYSQTGSIDVPRQTCRLVIVVKSLNNITKFCISLYILIGFRIIPLVELLTIFRIFRVLRFLYFIQRFLNRDVCISEIKVRSQSILLNDLFVLLVPSDFIIRKRASFIISVQDWF